MKQVIKSRLRYLCLLVSVCFFQAVALAQDSTVQSTQTTKTSSETTTYIAPWMWIVGGVVVVLILVLLLRGNSAGSTSSDRVTVTKTVERDTDV